MPISVVFQRVLDDADVAATELVEDWRSPLRQRGWLVVEDIRGRAHCERLLGQLGSLLPQYGGRLRHEVRFRPGFDDLQYSQSANAIMPHTEAPGHSPPPRFLALHCHHQARCGGGHTVLADGYELIRSLPAPVLEEAEKRPIRFDLATGASGAAPAPLLDRAGNTTLLRYSYNVMRDGALEGPARVSDDLDGIDPFHRELCRRGVEFNRRFGVAVLVPDDALLVIDNWRMLHSRGPFRDRARHLTRYWVG